MAGLQCCGVQNGDWSGPAEESHQPRAGNVPTVEDPRARLPRGPGILPGVRGRGWADCRGRERHFLRAGPHQETGQDQSSAGAPLVHFRYQTTPAATSNCRKCHAIATRLSCVLGARCTAIDCAWYRHA